jgi:hypothetical protein
MHGTMGEDYFVKRPKTDMVRRAQVFTTHFWWKLIA